MLQFRTLAAGLVLALVALPAAAGEGLPAGAVARLGATQVEGGTRAAVVHIAYSPDGTRIATCGKDATLRLWDSATGKEVRHWNDFPDALVTTTFSPDSRRLAAADVSGAIRVFDCAAPKAERELKGPPVPAALGWTRDGRTLVASGRGGQVHGWTAGAKDVAFALYKGQDKEGSFAALAPDSRLVIASTGGIFPGVGGSIIQVVHATEGRLVVAVDLWEPDDRSDQIVQTVCWTAALSPDSKYLATSQSVQTKAVRTMVAKSKVRLWEIATGKEVCALENLRVAPSLMAFSPDGRYLAYTTADGVSRGRIWGEYYVVLVDMLTRTELGRLQPDQGTLTCLAFSPTGKTFVTAGTEPGAVIWDFTRFLVRVPNTAKQPVADLAEEEVASFWNDLGTDDAARAYRAQAKLIVGGAGVTAFLKDKLHPAAAVDGKQIEKWIEDLDSEQFAVRQKATVKLAQVGALAETYLHKAQQGKISQEFRRRIELLVQKIDRTAPSSSDLQMVRALTVLERQATPAAREVVAVVAGGALEARLTQQAQAALERWAK